VTNSARSTLTCGSPLAGSAMHAASRPEARRSILENGAPGMRSAGMPRAGSKDVAFDHRLIASPLARKPAGLLVNGDVMT
jgi:hypothetical protein